MGFFDGLVESPRESGFRHGTQAEREGTLVAEIWETLLELVQGSRDFLEGFREGRKAAREE